MYDVKNIFASKTLWVSAVVTVVGALQTLDWVHLIPSGSVAGYVVTGLGVVMGALRFMTSQPVSVSGGK